MSRKKRTVSKVLQNASARAAGLESIDATLDLGNGMTLETYRAALEKDTWLVLSTDSEFLKYLKGPGK